MDASTLACTAFQPGAWRLALVGRAFRARAKGFSHMTTLNLVQVITDAMQVIKPYRQERALKINTTTMALAKPEPRVPTMFKVFLEAASHSNILRFFLF